MCLGSIGQPYWVFNAFRSVLIPSGTFLDPLVSNEFLVNIVSKVWCR